MTKKIEITDLILRDAHQSLIATRMRTEDMLPICDKLDSVGYWSLEVWGGATFDACVRFLKEDPWERLRQLRKALPNRSEEHTSELQSRPHLVCRLLLEKKKINTYLT